MRVSLSGASVFENSTKTTGRMRYLPLPVCTTWMDLLASMSTFDEQRPPGQNLEAVRVQQVDLAVGREAGV